MKKDTLVFVSIAIIGVLAVWGLVVAHTKTVGTFSGYTAGFWDSAEGYKVDGTTVIDGSGNYDGAITGTSMTLSGDAAIANLVTNGGVLSTSTGAAGTLLASDICDYETILVTPIAAATTLTFPATSTLHADCISAIGKAKTVFFYNATTTPGVSAITLAAGTGIQFMATNTTATVFNATEGMEITFRRISDATTTALISAYKDAD